jgi:hypothetical protein
LRMFEGKIWRRKNPHFGMMHMRKTWLPVGVPVPWL